jgi:hypothetical protein
MKIVTTQQAVLDIILEYWDNPTLVRLENTFKELEEYSAIRRFTMGDNWNFFLTRESYVAIGRKYLNRELTGYEIIVLSVNRTDLSLRLLTFADFKDDFEEVVKNTRFVSSAFVEPLKEPLFINL